MFFIIPWGELSLIGTTDLDDGDPPEEVAITTGEVDYLLGEAARHFPGTRLCGGDVVSSFAGTRPAGRPTRPSERRVPRACPVRERGGLISIGGGKYTTYRSMAVEVADRVMARLGRPRGTVLTDRLPLPGGAVGWEDLPTSRPVPCVPDSMRPPCVAWSTATGHAPANCWNCSSMSPELAAPVATTLPLLQVEVAYAADFEMARTPEDVLRRRAPQALLPGHGLAAVEAVAALLGGRLSLPPEQLAAAVASYRQRFSS